MKRKVTIFNIVENEIHDKRFPVTTACRVLRLRMEEPPPIWRVAANILTGHGPHFLLFSLTSLIVIFCILFSYSVYLRILCIVCVFYVMFSVNVYWTTATGCQPNCS